ncbi:MAG: LCP family protein [Thermoleophilia bacterium]|nr:LCP family protein [Thermoleophilia bacterium]
MAIVAGALVFLLLVGAGGAYLWFRQQVAGANERVTPEVRAALEAKPSSTFVPSTVTVAGPASTTTEVVESPSAMNILVLGSDRRQDDSGDPGRSDTIILVHVDPDEDYLSILSLPRDLRVNVPRHGKNKLNYAYAAGGPALTIQTVEQLTGVDIDHYLEVDFQAFRDIVDALGGVYIDVDRRYYNDDPRYELIRLAPGYQLLNGSDALDYVRFRHDQNMDFGRMERQQIFMAALREQAMGWDLPFKLPRLISALFHNVTTDLEANEILKLAYWVIRLDQENIRRLTLTGATTDIEGISYVVVGENKLSEAVTAFLTPPDKESSPVAHTSSTSTTTTALTTEAVDLSGVEVDVLNGNGREGEGAAAGRWLSDLGATVVTVDNANQKVAATVVEYPGGKLSQARQVAAAVGADSVRRNSSRERVTLLLGLDFRLPAKYALPPNPSNIPDAGGWKAIARMVPFPVRAPAYLPPGFVFVERMPPTGATYDIKVGGGVKPAFKMLYRLRVGGKYLDEYMGITETTWTDAPAACAGKEVRRGGKVFTVVGSRGKVDRVWWKEDGVLYWVSNTLMHHLSEEELLAVAESMIYIPPE